MPGRVTRLPLMLDLCFVCVVFIVCWNRASGVAPSIVERPELSGSVPPCRIVASTLTEYSQRSCFCVCVLSHHSSLRDLAAVDAHRYLYS